MGGQVARRERGLGERGAPLTRAYVGLGSNVGDRLQHLRRAVELLGEIGTIASTSGVYETDPVGPPQPDFLNAVVALDTDLGPRELLTELKRIEREIGRRPSERWGPREVDLDLLLHGQTEIASDDLTLPHPEATERAFVMVPLAEIAPDLELAGRTAAERSMALDRSGVRGWPEGL